MANLGTRLAAPALPSTWWAVTVGLERALECVWGPGLPEVTGRRAGRRYTLTEGDFHHLKNARLTHLHLPPLKIVTIHECDSGEASATATPHSTVVPKASLAIFQVSQVSGGPELRGGTPTPPPPSRHHLANPHPPPAVPLTSGWDVGPGQVQWVGVQHAPSPTHAL